MPNELTLHKPVLVAVWPGMGQVAVTAGYYLLSKLDMNQVAEIPSEELFEVDHVEVKDGLIRTGSLPRSRVFAWRDPQGRNDILLFFGEAQPPRGKYAFCRRLIEFALECGVERVFTFAAMATQMHPENASRVFGVATDEEALGEIKRLELELVEDGRISGLNGVLLGAAAEIGLRGTCLLGEMPHIFAQLPFPKASLAVLDVFATIARIEVDRTELAEHVQATNEELGELLASVEQAIRVHQAEEEEDEESFSVEPEDNLLSAEDQRSIEALFGQAADDRSKAYELKRELDRLEIFSEYEDRFLDLFKKQN